MKNIVLLLLTAASIGFLPNQHFGQAPNLGATSNFALFTAVGAFNNIGASTVVIGDVGTDVGAFNAFPPGILVGQVHVTDPVTIQAAADVALAYSDLSGRTCDEVLGTTLGSGQILSPKIYCLGGASSLNGTLTLDGQGDPTSIFIFQIDGALSTSVLSSVVVTNGANLCNVFWQINGAFFLGDGATFLGTVIAKGAITLTTGSILNGRALSTAGAISTSSNQVTRSLCMPPTISCTAPALVSCTNLVSTPDVSSVLVTATCPGTYTVIATGDVVSNQTCADRYSITRTYQVTDACGETATCAQTITVNDLAAPTLTCPPPASVSCASLVPAATTAGVNAGADNCGGAVTVAFVNDVVSSQTCPNRFTVTRTFSAQDLCLNSATCSQIITVNDLAAPTLTCPPPASVSCASLVPAATTAGVNAGADNCGGTVTVAFVNDVVSSQTCPNRFTVTRTFSAQDLCLNLATCSQIITVNDQTAPTLTCPPPASVSCASLVPAATTAGVNAGADNCGGTVTVAFVNDVVSSQTCPNRFTVTRTFSAQDLCLNLATCSQIITVNDQTAPTLTCPPPASVSCASLVPAATTAGVNAGADNCGGAVTVAFVNDVVSSQTCPNRFTVTRTFSAQDLCLNSATCSQIITVNDQTAPVFTSVPGNVTVNCNAIPGPGAALASDICGTVIVTYVGQTRLNGNCPGNYTLTRSWRATDACGNSTTAVQTLVVQDLLPPVFTTLPAHVTVQCNALPNVGSALASDQCSSPVMVSYLGQVITPGSCLDTYTILRSWQATDACGNTKTGTQRITVRDTNKPVFTVAPANITVECDAIPDIAPGMVVATDNCDAAVAITYNGQTTTAGYCPDWRIITRRWTAVDNCGNTASKQQLITVRDTKKPVFISWPQDVTLSCTDPIPLPGVAIATDNCDVSVTVTYLGEMTMNASCEGSYDIMRSWQATDNCGNWTSVAQLIVIQDLLPPVFTSVPANITLQCNDLLPPIGNPAATDNCGGYVQIVFLGQLRTNGSCLYDYTLTRSWKAQDLCGNSTVSTQVITVEDTQEPSFNSPPPDLTVMCGMVPNALTLTAQDNCGPAVATYLGAVQSPGNCTTGYTITHTWSAVDLCGNIATHVQVITVPITAPIGPPGGVNGVEPDSETAGLDRSQQTFRLLPNPTADKIGIDLNAFSGNELTVFIYNNLGKLIWSKHLEQVENDILVVSLRQINAPDGVYSVSLLTGGHLFSKRFILAN